MKNVQSSAGFFILYSTICKSNHKLWQRDKKKAEKKEEKKNTLATSKLKWLEKCSTL